MLVIFASLIAGILLGRYLLRGRNVSLLPKIIVFIVWLLLFSLGLEVGSDDVIMGNLGALGIKALLVAVAALAGSVLMSWGLWHLIGKRGIRTPSGETVAVSDDAERIPEKRGNVFVSIWNSLKGSLVIVAFFILGLLIGYAHVIDMDFQSLSLTRYVLYLLIFCVGITIGVDSGFVERIRNLDRKLMLLPLMTIIGTLAGVSVLWLLVRDYLLTDYLALGSGFAYYSLSSIFISEMRGVELGTIALLCNIFREILALLLVPLVARGFGPLAAISMGGATTFDTTLPVILQACGKEYLVVAAFHGCIVDLSVPFLVTAFCEMGGGI